MFTVLEGGCRVRACRGHNGVALALPAAVSELHAARRHGCVVSSNVLRDHAAIGLYGESNPAVITQQGFHWMAHGATDMAS